MELPLSPLTTRGLHAEREDAWDNCAAFGKVVAEHHRDGTDPGYALTGLAQHAARHDVAVAALHQRQGDQS